MALDSLNKVIDALSDGDDDNVWASLKTNALASFSAVDTIGRISFGLGSDLVREHMSRSFILSLNFIVMAGGHLWFAYSSIRAIYGPIVLVALGYAGTWLLVPSLLADLFGSNRFGTIIGVMMMANAIGIGIFYYGIALSVYDSNVDDASATCYSDFSCFRLTFLVSAGMALVASAAAALVTWLTHRKAVQEATAGGRSESDAGL